MAMSRKEKPNDIPRADVSYVGATKPPPPTYSNTSSPLPISPVPGNAVQVSYGPPSIVNSITPTHSSPIPKLMKQKSHPGVMNHGTFQVPNSATTHQLEKVRSELQRMQLDMPPMSDSDWETHEAIRQRELLEARTRAAQMEKTMRWWSDCTANWREKWSKVRNERNKAREENRLLRNKMENMSRDFHKLLRENNELKSKNEHLKTSNSSHSLKVSPAIEEVPHVAKENCDDVEVERTSPTESGCYNVRKARNRHSGDLDSLSSDAGTTPDGDSSQLEVHNLHIRLEESQKTVLIEREERLKIMDCMEKMEYELHQLRFKYDEMKIAKQEAVEEVSRLRDLHDDELCRMSRDLDDGTSSISSHQRTLRDLRDQVERLQAENASEWGARERVETEKLGLERENKKLKMRVEEIEEEVAKKKNLVLVESDKKALEAEVHEKNRDWSELKHAHTKLKKAHADKLTELEHSKRRADQFDTEVKKLRARVDELKRDLAKSEDEVDKQTTSARRAQRTNEELSSQVEHLQAQLDHSNSRLRRASSQSNLLGGSFKTINLLDSELSTDADDADD